MAEFKVAFYVFPVFPIISFHPLPPLIQPLHNFLIPFSCSLAPEINGKNLWALFRKSFFFWFAMLISGVRFTASVAENSQTNNIFNELLNFSWKSLKALANLWPPSNGIIRDKSNSIVINITALDRASRERYVGEPTKIKPSTPTIHCFLLQTLIMTCVLLNMWSLCGELIY